MNTSKINSLRVTTVLGLSSFASAASAEAATPSITPILLAQTTGLSMWGAMGWIMPIMVMFCLWEGISMIKKAAKSREKEERGGETFWGFVVAGAPMIIYGMLLKFTPVDIPFSTSLPF